LDVEKRSEVLERSPVGVGVQINGGDFTTEIGGCATGTDVWPDLKAIQRPSIPCGKIRRGEGAQPHVRSHGKDGAHDLVSSGLFRLAADEISDSVQRHAIADHLNDGILEPPKDVARILSTGGLRHSMCLINSWRHSSRTS